MKINKTNSSFGEIYVIRPAKHLLQIPSIRNEVGKDIVNCCKKNKRYSIIVLRKFPKYFETADVLAVDNLTGYVHKFRSLKTPKNNFIQALKSVYLLILAEENKWK